MHISKIIFIFALSKQNNNILLTTKNIYIMTKSVYEMYQEIKAIEVKELKDAVISKGGKYVFEEEHEPIVMINKFDSPCDAVIESVTVDDNGFLTMSAHDKECYQDTFTLFADEVAYGHIDFITNEIR